MLSALSVLTQYACMHAQSLQFCPTLCNPMDCSPPGSSVHGIFQARILGWDAMPSARGSSQPRDWTCISYIASIAGRFFTYCHTWEASFDMHCLLKNVTQALSLNAIFWETSVIWKQSGERSECAGWSAKEERWAEVQVNLYTQESNRNKRSQRPGTLVLIVGLHAYNLELVSVGLEYLWPFWSPQPPLRDPPCSYQSGPFWSFALDLLYYGLVLFSVVAEYKMCIIHHLLCCLS